MNSKINLRSRLTERIGIYDIHEIVSLTENNDKRKQELYTLLFDREDKVGYQAGWIFCHFNHVENRWLFDKQDDLIDEVLVCKHSGKRRLLLNMLYRQPLADPPRVDFLDFCLVGMVSQEETPGVKTLCMKLAYELCRNIPELLQEYLSMLDFMQPHLLPISQRTIRKNILQALKARKSLQRY